MILNAIEFEEKTRLKRKGLRSLYLPPESKIFNYLGKDVLYIGTLSDDFVITWVDLISPQDLLDLQDEDFQAFGVFLPKNIILEVLDFHKNHNDEFSLLIKQYPFAQLIFSQWLTMKLYEQHRELTKNPKLKYKTFIQEHFHFTYNGKTLNLYEAIEKMKIQEFNHKSDDTYSIISPLIALTDWEAITLYDFLYDMIPNSIKKVFLKDIETMKAYLPLKQESLEYKEIEYMKAKKVFESIYGKNKTFNETKIKKEWYCLEALSLKGYKLGTSNFFGYNTQIELLIPKAKQNKLGIGYDELLELVNRSEKDLKYPEIWEFESVEAPELDEYEIDEDGNKVRIAAHSKHILDYNFQSSWKDVIKLQSEYYPYANSYLELYSGEIWDRGSVYISDREITQIASEQYFQSIALIIQNNFHTDYVIFESTRQKMKQNKELAFDSVMLHSRYGCSVSCLEASSLKTNAFLSYRFNQALALVFLNAYAPKKESEN